MTTYSALTTLRGEEPARGMGEAMERMTPAPEGLGVFEMEDGSGLWEVGGYFTAPPDEAALALLAAAFDARPFAVSALPETDWVDKVQRELAPVRAGRFHLYGSHDAGSVPDGVVALLVDAAMAFGTGHHGTTTGCLQAYEALLQEDGRPGAVADIGCGTAVLAMAAARTGSAPVVAGDVDAVAVEVASANLRLNALADRVTCVEAAGFDHPAFAAAAPFDLIFANILKAPLIELAPSMAGMSALGGRAILSGILDGQADEVAQVYAAAGYSKEARLRIGDWVTLTLRREAI